MLKDRPTYDDGPTTVGIFHELLESVKLFILSVVLKTEDDSVRIAVESQ